MHNNYNKIRDKLYEVLSYLEDARSDPSKLEQLTKNCGEKSKKSIDRCKGKGNCPQSNKVQKNDVPESDFDSTLIIKRQLNDICPFSNLNKLLEFDKDIVTPDSNVSCKKSLFLTNFYNTSFNVICKTILLQFINLLVQDALFNLRNYTKNYKFVSSMKQKIIMLTPIVK